MRKFVFVVLFLILILAIGAGSLFISRVGPTDTIATAILIPTSKTVEVKLPSSTQYTIVTEQINVEVGSLIRTGEEGEATIVFQDNSILSMDISTEVRLDQIPDDEQSDTNIFQLVGNTWHRVQSVVEGGSYEVETESLVAAVRGTSFGIEINGQGDDQLNQVVVNESEVDVAPISGGNRREFQRVNQQEVISFTRAQIDEGINPRVSQLVFSQSEGDDSWTSRHIKIDRDLTGKERLEDRLEVLNIQSRLNAIESIDATYIDRVKDAFEQPHIGKDYCDKVKEFELSEIENRLEIKEARLMQLEYAIEYCSDGEVTQLELEVLEGLTVDADMVEPLELTALRTDFDIAISDYFETFYRGASGEEQDCQLIKQTTEDQFVQGIKDLEAQYGVAEGDHELPLEDFKQRRQQCFQEISI
jgi:hypothetical protein